MVEGAFPIARYLPRRSAEESSIRALVFLHGIINSDT